MSDTLTQYGTTVIPLTDFVRQYLIGRGDVKMKGMARTLILAQKAYRDLFRTTLWEPKCMVLKLNEDDTIQLPDYCEKVINISVVDALGKWQTLSLDPYWNTVDIKCTSSSCSCTSCNGTDSLCGALDAITATTKGILIGDGEYTQTTWLRKNGCSIEKAIKTPYWDPEKEEVVYRMSYETVCTVEVNDKGCITYTSSNISALQENFGYWFNYGYLQGSSTLRELIPTTPNNYGTYNYNASNKSIIHIFRPKRNISTQQFYNAFSQTQETLYNNIDQVIVQYMPNGDTPGAEILIPQYAQSAMEAYIMYDTERLRPNNAPARVEYYLQNFRREKKKMNDYLYPIRMIDIALMQTIAKRW